MTDNIKYGLQSLKGLWIGDCLGNMGQLYYVGDLLTLLERSEVKLSGKFRYSDDTEEAIVLYNHIVNHDFFGSGHVVIDQDKLAQEFAERYVKYDPTGEEMGYGFNTRKLLREIYDGKPWKEANKIKFNQGESQMSLLTAMMDKTNVQDAIKAVSEEAKRLQQRPEQNVGSCGNGSAMRVAPLGPLCGYYDGGMDEDILKLPYIKERAWLQAEVTHDHIEGKAGAVAVALSAAAAMRIALKAEKIESTVLEAFKNPEFCKWYSPTDLLWIPTWSLGRKWKYSEERDLTETKVVKQLKIANDLPFDTPIGKAVEILGNGSHVTCQDTVPLCLWLAAKNLGNYKQAILDTCIAFGDVDTNCAIVGGIVGITDPPPEEWAVLCKPMEEVYDIYQKYPKDYQFKNGEKVLT